MSAAEILPPGVGRVPQWWMEVTPHYTLEEDDQEERRLQQDRLAYYGMQLEAAHAAGVLNPDGTPKLGADLRPMAWTPLTTWNKLDASSASNMSQAGSGERNFKPGQPVIDPQMFGIAETDPDYQAYLTGAKLPPGYFEIMGQMMATAENGGTTEGILNNLKQTDYGRYGHQAENPRFKPAWIKKKLRSTDIGANIRQGQYDDSPNKHVRSRRVNPEDVQLPAAPSITHNTNINNNPVPLAPAPTAVSTQNNNDDAEDTEELLRQHQEKLLKLQQLQLQLQQQKEQEEQQQHVVVQASSSFKVQNPFDNAGGSESNLLQQHQEEEEEVIEEVYDDEDYSYEEEIVEDDGELDDLQAILAAKQAELESLQAQL